MKCPSGTHFRRLVLSGRGRLVLCGPGRLVLCGPGRLVLCGPGRPVPGVAGVYLPSGMPSRSVGRDQRDDVQVTQLPAGAGRVEDDRRTELRDSLMALRERIAAACAAAGRPEADVALIAVTKTFPVADIRLLSELGITQVGENKDQEAAPKVAECAALGLSLNWHFVGQVQVNKAASVASYADVIHSVDRPRLVSALGRRAVAAGRQLSCLIQVSLDGAAGRGGALAGQVPGLADEIAAEPGLSLGGVMAVAPLGAAPRPAYAKLREIAGIVRSAHPEAMAISAGMSGDLEEAIAEGATLVRIGTALLGGRRAFVR
jgi:pyridoxal phosphate enzyme (YggS family)